MTSAADRREERDRNLLTAFGAAGRQLRWEYREWLQQEIVDLVQTGDLLETTLPDGRVKRQVHDAVRRMRQIDRHELKQAITELDEKCAEATSVAWDSVLDGSKNVDEGVHKLRNLLEELWSFREFLVSLAGTDDEPPEE